MEKLLKSAKEMKDVLIRHRRYLHQNAETGFDTPKTDKYIWDVLKEYGYSPEECGKRGIKACIGTGSKNILLRADTDALPISEETGLPFSSAQNMHACGHDMHTAMLLGAAKLLKERERKIKGKVTLMFQPAEEILEGAKDMIEKGILKAVDGAMMIHVITGVDLPAGTAIVCSPGVSAPASDHFTVNIKGKGCHGSAPWQGVDSALICGQIVNAFQVLQSRETEPMEETVLTVGYVRAGDAGNALADTAILKGTARSYSEKTREYLQKRITEISSYVARTYRGEAEVIFTAGTPPLINERNISHSVYENTLALLGGGKVYTTAMISPDGRVARGGGSEDFAYISEKVPAVMVSLAAGEKERGFIFPQHHPKADFDESVLPIGAAIYAWNGIRLAEGQG
ncbi:MAG: amidohydrolase [Clostridia bacterium]|nr:amidohydrolase [Clostridia bacterium]